MNLFLAGIDWNLVFQAGVLVVAIWGAALSTYIFVKQRHDRRPVIETELAFGLIGGYGVGASEQMLFIIAKNKGERAVHLQVPFLALPRGQSIVAFKPGSDVDFPHELPPGKSCRVWLQLSDVENHLVELDYSNGAEVVGVYPDAVGNSYKSKPTRIVPDVKESPTP